MSDVDLSGLSERARTFIDFAERQAECFPEMRIPATQAVIELVRLLGETQALLRPELPEGWEFGSCFTPDQVDGRRWIISLWDVKRERPPVSSDAKDTIGDAIRDVIAKAKEIDA